MPVLFENCLPTNILGIVHLFVKQLRPSQLERLETLSLNHPVILAGDCFMRPTSKNGTDFTFPEIGEAEQSVIAWSHITNGSEILCAHNPDKEKPASVYVTVDNEIHAADSKMECIYASDLSLAELDVESRNGKSVRIFIPANGLVIYH